MEEVNRGLLYVKRSHGVVDYLIISKARKTQVGNGELDLKGWGCMTVERDPLVRRRLLSS